MAAEPGGRPYVRDARWLTRYWRSVSPHAVAAPVRGDLGNQFAALVLRNEGLYDVHVEIDGPLGRAIVDSRIEATYDTRPPAYMLIWYLVPFLLAGFLWTQLLLRRRRLFRKG